jgi:hypothetical protein
VTEAKTTNTEQLLNDLDGGVFAEKIGRALSEVASGVVYTGKKGEVIVKFAIKRIGDSSQVECAHSIAFAAPTPNGKVREENTTTTPLHVGQRGALTLFPETQQQLFARETDHA